MHQGNMNLIIESNSLLIVDQLSATGGTCNSALDNIVLDIRKLMSGFLNCKIVSGRRACNSVAHILARNA